MDIVERIIAYRDRAGRSREGRDMLADAANEIMRLRREIDMQWKPIETAPKDGTVIVIPLQMARGVRAYWDKELETWVLCQPVNVESIREPISWRSENP